MTYCGDVSHRFFAFGIVSECFRGIVFLCIPGLFASWGFIKQCICPKPAFPLRYAAFAVGLLDWFRVSIALLVGVCSFVKVLSYSRSFQLGYYLWVDLAVDSSIWILYASKCILWELRSGSSESLHLKMFSMAAFLMECLNFWGTMQSLAHDGNDEYSKSTVLAFGFMILFLKWLFCFLYTCFNRDVILLQHHLNEQSQGLYESLLPQNDLEGRLSRDYSPEAHAGIFSRITFSWLSPIMTKGARGSIEKEDLFQVMHTDTATSLADRFAVAYEEKLRESGKSIGSLHSDESQPGQLWVLVSVLSKAGVLKPFYYASIFRFITDVLKFASPFMLKWLMRIVDESTGDDPPPAYEGYCVVGLMFFFSCVQTMTLQRYFHMCIRAGMRIRACLITNAFRKALKLSQTSREKRTTGEIVNLMSTDCERLNSIMLWLHTAWSSPLQLIVALYLLWQQIGPSSLASILFMTLFLTPLTSYVATRMQVLSEELMLAKDERVRVTSEVLTNIKVIKLYGWEDTLRDNIFEARAKEIKVQRKYAYMNAVSNLLFAGAPVLVTMVTFASFVLLGGHLTASKAFVSIALLNLLKFPLSSLPYLFNFLAEASVSARRLDAFLRAPEVDTKYYADLHDRSRPSSGNAAVYVANGNFFWDDAATSRALMDIKLTIPTGSMTIITGSVGAGKSALMKMIIGDLTVGRQEPSLCVNGSLAYCPQVPWIMNMSLRDNILFGKPYNREWYNLVIDACCLTDDLMLLEDGDRTEIGERGINVSGGQKARISLARAVYSKSDILLLESIFEAVDEHVAHHIFHNCLLDLLKRPDEITGKVRTVILVTHALKFVSWVDWIVIMSQGGILEQGTYDSCRDGAALGTLMVVNSAPSSEKVIEEQPEFVPVMRKLSSWRNLKRGADQGEEGVTDLIQVELKDQGAIGWSTYIEYISALGGFPVLSILVCGMLAKTLLDTGTNLYLSDWTNRIEHHTKQHSDEYYLGLYSLLGVSGVVCNGVFTLYLSLKAVHAAKMLHDVLTHNITRAKMSFFDTTPLGRILNRFSKDINTIDEALWQDVLSVTTLLFEMIGTLGSIVYVVPMFTFIIPLVAIMYIRIQNYYISSSRELKRWDSILRSPIISHFSESLEGSSSIRAYGLNDQFCVQNVESVDIHNGAYYTSVSTNRWLAFHLDTLGNLVVFSAGVFVIAGRQTLPQSLAGLAISYSMQITMTLTWAVRSMSDLETDMIAVERIAEYRDVAPEAPIEAIEPKLVPRLEDNWPSRGEIVMNNVFANYRPGLGNVLKGLQLRIEAGEKVGIVGRTGAGKSSLFLVLLRLIEPNGGNILIDGFDTKRLGLNQLRRSCAIIPQEPIMFQTTLRKNMDPRGEFSDDEITQALELSHLKSHVSSLCTKDSSSPLDVCVSEGGSNFSFGQRQLLCIARAVLRRCKIILLDEATSGIDNHTDELIQATIRSEFKKCTVLTIAHRLSTIMDGDKVAVMDAGRLAEYGAPDELLSNPNGLFASLVDKMKKSNNH